MIDSMKIAVVQCYIHILKGVQVDINLEQFRDPKNRELLDKAYSIAQRFMDSYTYETVRIVNFGF